MAKSYDLVYELIEQQESFTICDDSHTLGPIYFYNFFNSNERSFVRIVLSFLFVSFFALSSDGHEVFQSVVKAIKDGNKDLFDNSLHSLVDPSSALVATNRHVTNLVGLACAAHGEHTSYFIKQLIDKGSDFQHVSDIYHKHTYTVDYEFLRVHFTWKDKVGVSWLPLDVAIFAGNVDAVKTLLTYNVDLEKSALNYNPSMIAKWVGESALEHAKLYKQKKELGPDICQASEQQLDTIIELLEKKVKENEEFDADLKASGMQMCNLL